MKKLKGFLGLAVFALIFVAPPQADAVTFADGLVHTIDAANSFPLESAIVMDGPGGATTTVRVVAGGQVSGIEAYGSSFIDVQGGSAGGIEAYGSSFIDVQGGGAGSLVLYDNTSASLSGGSGSSVFGNCALLEMTGGSWGNFGHPDGLFCETVHMTDGFVQQVEFNATNAEVTGGEFGTGDLGRFSVSAQESLVITGGTFGTDSGSLSATGGNVQISGGSWNEELRVAGLVEISAGVFNGRVKCLGGTTNISGGQFDGFLVSGNGSINILGGSIGGQLTLLDTGVIILVGSGFTHPLGDVTSLSGTVGGTLSSGEPFLATFARASTTRLILSSPNDSDLDGVLDEVDNCPLIENPSQEDTDADGVGDACNDGSDSDGDEYADSIDNCPDTANVDQLDSDADLLGDACDPFPNDPDNEQAQCELDLTVCDADLLDCQSDPALVQCQADLAQCQTDAGQCSTDLTLCLSSEAQCQTNLSQANTDLSTCEISLTAEQAALVQCNTDLSACLIDEGQCQADLSTTQTDLATTQADLSQANADLTTCEASLTADQADLIQCQADLASETDDADGDGRRDLDDTCPGTAPAELADLGGCSQSQFCAQLDVTIRDGRRPCRRADWHNDEPGGRARDCAIDHNQSGREDDTCAVRPE
jgi:hypothetical protein